MFTCCGVDVPVAGCVGSPAVTCREEGGGACLEVVA